MASRRLNSDRFFTTDFTPAVYSPAGMRWIDENSMRTVLRRRHPDLASVLRDVANAFAGFVTRTDGGLRTVPIACLDAAHLLRPPPIPPPVVPARGHPARCLVVHALHAQLPGRRGPAGRAWPRPVLRDDPAPGAEVRAGRRRAA